MVCADDEVDDVEQQFAAPNVFPPGEEHDYNVGPNAEKQITIWFRCVHANLGRPSSRSLQNMFKAARAHPVAAKLVDRIDWLVTLT